jgi:ADP-heptose:LPS heptosyltransferase
VKRYRGEELPPSARVALIENDALGNYVVSTPLIQMLRDRFPTGRLDLFAGSRTAELWEADARLDSGMALFGAEPSETLSKVQALAGAGYDLVVNIEASPLARVAAAVAAGADGYVVGPCLGPDGRDDLAHAEDERGDLWRDQAWIAADLPSRYPFLRSGFIGEIFCRLAYLEGEVPGYRLAAKAPPRDVPDVLIATSASLPEKLWPAEKWLAATAAIADSGRTVGLLGAPARIQSRYWQGNDTESRLVQSGHVQDLRGAFSLPEVVGAIAAARGVLTLDNGILHLAAATQTPTVGLFRFGIHRLWAPPAPNVRVLTPLDGETVATISVESVLEGMGLG